MRRCGNWQRLRCGHMLMSIFPSSGIRQRGRFWSIVTKLNRQRNGEENWKFRHCQDNCSGRSSSTLWIWERILWVRCSMVHLSGCASCDMRINWERIIIASEQKTNLWLQSINRHRFSLSKWIASPRGSHR